MQQIIINNNQFSDLLNLLNGVFHPVTNFVSKKEFLEIINFKKYNSKFFPLPIFFGVNKKQYLKIKNEAKLTIKYKKKEIMSINNINFYNLDRKKICKKIYGKNFRKHPFYKKFIIENYRFMTFKFVRKNYKNLTHEFFVSPDNFKKKIRSKNHSFLASFHTRNVPHKAHQWIHQHLYKRFGALLIQPLIGQYKKGEYNDRIIIKTNKLAGKLVNSNKVYSIPFFSYPRYAGYREAALHAIVRKNYGCTHFWVGRDHAGFKKFYNYYQSQKYCSKNQKKLKIKIIAGKEPFYCRKCGSVKNTFCKSSKCKKKDIVKISGSKIRNLLNKKKSIPNYLMDPRIAKLLSKNSLIN